MFNSLTIIIIYLNSDVDSVFKLCFFFFIYLKMKCGNYLKFEGSLLSELSFIYSFNLNYSEMLSHLF